MAGNSTLLRRVQLWVNEDTSRITATANAHFNAVSAQTLEKVEELYPQTTHALFDSALHVIEEKWGSALKDRFSMPSELISSPRTVLALLLVNISFYETPVTEIFYPFQEDPQWHQLKQRLKECDDEEIYQFIFSEDMQKWIDRLTINPEHLQGLMQMFDSFIDNLNNPSSPLIHLFLENNLKDKAVQAALSLRHPIDKSKSMVELIDLFLLENNLSKALEIWSQIPIPADKHRMAIKLINKILDNGLTDQALGFVANHPKHHERDLLTKEIALALSKKGEVTKALDIIRTIDDKDLQHFTRSRMVRLLAQQNKIHIAKEIAFSILDEDYKQDAIIEIVKVFLQHRKVDEAIKFVESLAEGEKKKPAQAIEIALKAHHQDEKVRSLRRIFSLYQVWQYGVRVVSPIA